MQVLVGIWLVSTGVLAITQQTRGEVDQPRDRPLETVRSVRRARTTDRDILERLVLRLESEIADRSQYDYIWNKATNMTSSTMSTPPETAPPETTTQPTTQPTTTTPVYFDWGNWWHSHGWGWRRQLTAEKREKWLIEKLRQLSTEY